MPRYGDFNAVLALREPHHIYIEGDIVPSIPPAWLGYASCTTEYRTDGVGFEKRHSRETVNFARWIGRLIQGTAIANHDIELYEERLGAQLAGVPTAGGRRI